MRLIRTAAGGFLNVHKIVRLADERATAADSWVAICADGDEIPLAAYYSAPGRIERELPDLVVTAMPVPPKFGDTKASVAADCLSAPLECCVSAASTSAAATANRSSLKL